MLENENEEIDLADKNPENNSKSNENTLQKKVLNVWKNKG
jgi:hypothetical protein